MPDRQRGVCVAILCIEASSARIAPAQLVCRNASEDRAVKLTRSIAVKQMLEVEGVTVRMLAGAFRRDPSTIRSWRDHPGV